MDIREYFQKEQKGFYKIIAKTLTTERRKQLYDAINEWQLKNENMKTIAQQLNVKVFPFRIKNSQGNIIYLEDSRGYWIKKEFDSQGNEVYWEDSMSLWVKREFDSQGNEIYYENSKGYWEKCSFDSQDNRIYYEESTGLWEKCNFDSQSNLIYSDDSDGYWTKREYDSLGNEIYYENSNGYIKDNRNIPEYTMEELVEIIGKFKLKK